MTTLTLAEEVMLLSLDDDTGAGKEQANAEWAVAGAVLVELAMAERTEIRDDKLVVLDPTPLGVPYLDAELAEAAKRGPSTKVKHALEHARKEGVKGATQALVARGVLREEKKKVLGLFPVARYPEAEGSAERELRERLNAVILHGQEPDGRTAALVALLHGGKLQRLAFSGGDRKRIARRMAEVANGQWVEPAVRKAIEQAEAVMMIIMTTMVTTTVITN